MSRKRHSSRELIEADLEMLPFMGLFIVLIPMLLISAVFVQISVVDLNLPDESDGQTGTDPFTLTVSILDGAFVVRADGYPDRRISRAGAEPLAGLTEALAQIASGRPDHRAVTILSEAETRYEDIISVMDASREAGLPDVSLSGGTP